MYDPSMAVTPDILADILRLPADERARLALELIRSLDTQLDADADEQWDTEIQRRGVEVEAGTAETMSLAEYRAHVRARQTTGR
jgi:putative addiction module component (TIGR02574 family)